MTRSILASLLLLPISLASADAAAAQDVERFGADAEPMLLPDAADPTLASTGDLRQAQSMEVDREPSNGAAPAEMWEQLDAARR